MESIMLSVKPSFFKLIAEGTKNIELRKTRPKLEVPFKCFVYYNNTSTLTIAAIRLYRLPVLRKAGNM